MYGIPKSPVETAFKVEKAENAEDPNEGKREAALRLKKQAITELEIKRNLDSIKKSWKRWGTSKKEGVERLLQVNERTEYGSHFYKLGAKMHPVHLEYSDNKARRPFGLHQMTEHQFINEGTSDSEGEVDPRSDISIMNLRASRQQSFGT